LGTTVTLAAYCHKTARTHDGIGKKMLTTAEEENKKNNYLDAIMK
jgi:hypothetical protein